MADDDADNVPVTVSMPEGMVEDVEARLDYGDSRAGWIREAVRQRIESEDLLETNYPSN